MDSIIARRHENEQRMNELVGRMIRKLFEFEEDLVSPQTSVAIQYVIEQAMQQAHAFGLDAEEVRRIAARITHTRQNGPVPLVPTAAKSDELDAIMQELDTYDTDRKEYTDILLLLTRAVKLIARRDQSVTRMGEAT